MPPRSGSERPTSASHSACTCRDRLPRRDKYAALAIADAFVSTSQHEGFGLVFLEAMACGLPIVCYDRGGQTDFLASGETGFVVQLNDTDRVRPRSPCNLMPTFICGGASGNGTDSWWKTIS